MTGGASVAALMLALAAPASAESLSEAMQTAYENNPTLQAQRALVRATDERVNQALSGWRPDVRITGSGGRIAEWRNAAGGNDSGRYQYSTGLTVTQNVYDGGQTIAATDRAENDIRAERARLDDVEQDLLLNVASVYMSVLRDQAVLELNRNNERVLGRQMDATRDRFEVGEVTRTDVAQAEARVAGSAADRIQAEGFLEISRAQYLRIVGKLPENLQDPPLRENLPKSRDDAIALAVENNPNVRAAMFDQESARSLVRQVEGELLPTVDVVGRAQKSRNAAATDSSVDSLALTAQLTVPIYQQGEVTSRVREAKHLVSRRQQIIEEARRAAAEDAKSAWERLETARARRDALNSETRAAQIALEGVRQEARVGSRTVLDVLDAEQELLDAQVDLVRAERDEVVARFEVLAAIGQLTAQSIGLGGELYDPQAHYREVRGKLWGLGDDLDGKNKP